MNSNGWHELRQWLYFIFLTSETNYYNFRLDQTRSWSNLSKFKNREKTKKGLYRDSSLHSKINNIRHCDLFFAFLQTAFGPAKIIGSFKLTDTGEDSKLVNSRKLDTLFSSLFSDASERRVWLSAESKILASTFGRFACIG